MYEVITYITQEDYDNYNRDATVEDIGSKRDALREGRLWLSDHAVVKVQSYDREYIEVLTAKVEL